MCYVCTKTLYKPGHRRMDNYHPESSHWSWLKGGQQHGLSSLAEQVRWLACPSLACRAKSPVRTAVVTPSWSHLMSLEEICLFEDVNSTLKTSKPPFLEIFVTLGGLVVVLPDVSTRTKVIVSNYTNRPEIASSRVAWENHLGLLLLPFFIVFTFSQNFFLNGYLNFKFTYFMCMMSVWPACLYVYHIYVQHMEIKRGSAP